MFAAHLRARGFTLIEMAIVLFIMSLLLAAGVSVVNSWQISAREKATRQNMDAIKAALQTFVGRTGRLPCPAVATNAPTSTTFGVEAPTPGNCTGTTALGATGYFGVVPWKTLGLSAEGAVDGWQNQFHYAVTKASTLTSLTTLNLVAMKGVLTLHSDAPITNGLPATGNQINACSTTAGDNTCNAFASAIIISHGPNGLGAHAWAGTAQTAPTSNRELANTGTSVAFVRADYSEVSTTYYDDIVMTLAPADVLANLVSQGAIKSEYTLLTATFKNMVAILASYSIEIRSGTAGSYSYPFPSASATSAYTLDSTKFNASCDSNPPNSIGTPSTTDLQLTDPWGTQIKYQRASNATNAGESCSTYAVFVSAGPDGSFATTSDNYVYYVSKGELDAIIGLSGW